MIEFATTEVHHALGTIEAACLVTSPDALFLAAESIVKDGEIIALPRLVVSGIVDAIRACAELETSGKAVDCSVFSTLMLGGSYDPVDLATYQRDLHWAIDVGSWLREEDIFGVPAAPRMVQFIDFQDRIIPKHTAVQLPDAADLYVQKIGHGLPIALTDAAANFRFHRANSVASIDRIRAGYREGNVLAFTAPDASADPMTTYHGSPG